MHIFSILLLFNQSNFDWILISQDNFFSFFAFSLLSGLLYFCFIYLFLKSSEQIYYIPLFLSLSYLVPGFFLVGKFIYVSSYKLSIKRMLNLVFLSFRYMTLNVFERLYSMAIFIFASWFIGYSIVGEFRIAHIFYSFISSIAIFLGMAMFNNAFIHSSSYKRYNIINEINFLIVLILFPLIFLNSKILSYILSYIPNDSYLLKNSALFLVPYVLIIPAIANFSRQIIIATSKNIFSTISYGITILVSLLFILFLKKINSDILLYILSISDLLGIIIFIPVFIYYGFNNYKKFLKYFAMSLFFWLMINYLFIDSHHHILLFLKTMIYLLVFVFYLIVTIYWFKKMVKKTKHV